MASAAGVTPGYVVRADVRENVLRTLRIENTGAGVIKWRCSGPCRRSGGPAERITHPRGATVIHRLNLRLLKRTALKINVVVPSGQSRHLTVAVSNRRLVVSAAGCIDAAGRRGACALAPVTAPAPPVATSPVTTPVVTATTPVPTAAPPANDPDGQLERVTRVGPSHARVSGWAADADAASAAITVCSLVEGTAAAEAAAALSHAVFAGHGFNFLVPVDDTRRTICVLAMNLGGGTDRLLKACRQVPELADLDDDTYIGCSDQGILLSQYGKDGVELAGDLTNDGRVNLFDLSMLLSRFRQPPGEPSPCP